MIKLFELFAGYGSQSLALKRLGIEFKNVGYCEIDKYAIQAHKALHGEDIPNFGDITKVDAESLPDMDFLTYSFPCQDISVAGKGMGLSQGSGTRSSLLWECHKIIAAKKPKYLMMENVKNLVGKKNLPDFQSWINELRELGYNNYYKVINAKDCGVPQNRERVFCVSIRRDADEGTFRFNEPFDNGVRIKDLLEDEVDEKFYIADEKVEKLLEQLKNKNQEISYCIDANYYKGTTPEQFLEKSRRQLVAVPCLTPDRIEKRQSGGRQPHIICEQRSDEGLRFFKNNTCGTLRTIDACGDKRVLEVSNNYRIRKLTPKECFRLMGLTDEEIQKIQNTGISNSQQYKMAGNSIVVDQMFFLKNLF